MPDSIKIEVNEGGTMQLDHFQKLEIENEAFGRVIGVLANTPQGTHYRVTVARKNGRPFMFDCDTTLDKEKLLATANYKKRARKATAETSAS